MSERNRNNNYKGSNKGYQGRGKGKNNNHNNNNRNNSKQTKLMKFTPNGQIKGNTHTFASVKEHIVQHIQKTYDKGKDVADSLDNMEKIDLTTFTPERQISAKADKDEKIVDQQGLDMIYKEKLTRYEDRVEKLEEGLSKAYSLIFNDYCTQGMRVKLEAYPEFDKEIKNNPIKLLEAIQEVTNTPVRAQYAYGQLTAAMRGLLSCFQKENEPLNEYIKRFKQHRDIVKGHVGDDKLLDNFVEEMEIYKKETDNNKKKILKADAFETWMSYLLLTNSDQKRYKTLVTGMQSQFSLQNDQYPKTLTAVGDALSNHPWDKKPSPIENKPKENADDQTGATSFAQKQQQDMFCYCCGKPDHVSTTCPKKKGMKRDDWYVNKAHNYIQNSNDQEDQMDSDDEDNQSVQSTGSTSSNRSNRSTSRNNSKKNDKVKMPWHGFQACCYHANDTVKHTDLNEVLLLDTGSSIDTIRNPNLVHDIRRNKTPIAMNTNAGTKQLQLDAEIPGYQRVHYSPDIIANIMSFGNMANKYKIRYDNTKEDAFFVELPEGGELKFARTPEGLYAYKPTEKYLASIAKMKNLTPPNNNVKDNELSIKQPIAVSNLVSTVKENRLGYTQRQFERAKRARALYHKTSCPSLEAFKHLIRQNIIQDCPVTVEDINIAERIFGPDVGTLKGKTTRRNITKAVVNDKIEIPKELITQHNDITWCMDIMYANGMPFMTGIDTTLRFRSLVVLPNRTGDELYKGMDKVFRQYNNAGFLIATIRCDQEFKTHIDTVKDELSVDMNYTTTGEHESTAERNNRTIGERMRAMYHILPYNNIPKLMVQTMGLESVFSLNLFPAKGGVSSYYSPHILLGQRPINYKRELTIPFGQYVQAYHEASPKNTQAPRTIDAIYLRPARNMQGGHELMNLATGLKITRPRVWTIPVTDLVIQRVHELAARDGMKSLKLQTRMKTPLFPADWIAGVDFAESNNEDDDSDEENYEDACKDNDDDMGDDDYDDIDQDEIDDILAEPRTNRTTIANPIDNNNDNDNDNDENETSDEEEEKEEEDDDNAEAQVEAEANDDGDDNPQPSTLRRSSRRTVVHNPLNIASSKGTTYTSRLHDVNAQTKQSVKFDNKVNNEHMEKCYNLFSSATTNTYEYALDRAMLIGRLITDLTVETTKKGVSFMQQCFGQQYLLQKGLKVFGTKGKAATMKEMDQLHKRACFTPTHVKDLTDEERKKAQQMLLFLTEKRDGTVKARGVYDGKPTREWFNKEDTASPTVATESIMLTTVIDAKEERDIMSTDLPNAFVQTHLPKDEDGTARIIMKITGVLVDILTEMAPEIYAGYVVYENGRKVLYVIVLKAIYGMLISALLWYNKLRKDLESIGFVFNPYDPCVANRMVKGKQHTIRFHVDDMMSSHILANVNTKFLKWLNKMYGTYGEVTATRGTKHEFLGMTFDFSQKGKVIIDMIPYINAMVDDFSQKLKPNETRATPAAEDLFAEGNSPKLAKQDAEEFHTFVAKGLFACKRARPDIHTAIAILCTRVKAPNQDDRRKLIDLLKYLNGTRNDKLILSADDLHVIKWFVDAAFAVHPDFKSHTGGGMTYGKGIIQSQSRKQKLNTKSSTEAELVATDDLSTMMLWTRLFMEAQGYKIKQNILHQDNKSTIKLLENGKKSSSKRTRALNIRYFFLADQIEKGTLEVEYCPTDDMTGDFWTKPKQGKQFQKLKKSIMGH